MPTENPDQSPKGKTTPERTQSRSDVRLCNHPTWRFWVLVTLVWPLLAVTSLGLLYVFDATSDVQMHLVFGIPFAIGLAIYVVSIIAIPIIWRGVSPLGIAYSVWKRRLFLFALTMLAMLAAPSAFMSLCGPISATFVELFQPAVAIQYLAIVFSVFGGAIGTSLVILLARGLWLDAIGRPKKPTDDEAQRPIPRLRARQPIERD